MLDRSSINSIFSNFIDIWNLHRSFLAALDDVLSQDKPLNLSPLLLSHFPYLSLYNPFITAFPSILTALTELSTPPIDHHPNSRYNVAFAHFLAHQEADPRCGRLKLRDWLLTIVQRCPRYLLLLKDLIAATSIDDPEHTQLIVVHGLVSKSRLHTRYPFRPLTPFCSHCRSQQVSTQPRRNLGFASSPACNKRATPSIDLTRQGSD